MDSAAMSPAPACCLSPPSTGAATSGKKVEEGAPSSCARAAVADATTRRSAIRNVGVRPIVAKWGVSGKVLRRLAGRFASGTSWRGEFEREAGGGQRVSMGGVCVVWLHLGWYGAGAKAVAAFWASSQPHADTLANESPDRWSLTRGPPLHQSVLQPGYTRILPVLDTL